jgi:YVTN family beta-propeller protein
MLAPWNSAQRTLEEGFHRASLFNRGESCQNRLSGVTNMTKSERLLPLVFFLTILFCAESAHAAYKITANVVDLGQECFITGQIKDDQGNPVYPAEMVFTCGSIQTKYPENLPGGYYMVNPPPCNDFSISVTAVGMGTVSAQNVSVAQNTLLTYDLVFPSEANLEQAITALQVIAGSHPTSLPPDRNGDSRIGIEDALYVLQSVAELRGTGATPLSIIMKFSRTPMFVFMQAVLSRDTDGDGVDDWFETAFADAYGYLEISDLAEGIYTLTVMSTDSTKAVRVENIQVLGSDVNLRTLRLTPVGSISGTVQLEGASDHGSIHVYVPGTSYDATTDSAGSFTISGVPEGTYAVKAEKANYGTITMKDIPVLAGQDSVMDPFILPSVVGSATGFVWLQAAADYTGILITLRRDVGTTYLTTTDSIGDYAFFDVPIGSYQLIATMPGYVSQQAAVTIATGSNTLPSKNLLINTNKGTLSGTITRNNISVHSGIQVIIAGTGYAAFTDEAGAYTLINIPQGTYTVFVKADGYSARRFENVQITKSQVTTLNAVLTAQSGVVGSETCGSIIGTVRYSDKTDHSGISIKVEGTAIPLAGTDQNGGFIINNVPSGNYTLLFTQANYKTIALKGVEIVPWGTAFIRDALMIPPVGRIRGTVSVEGTGPNDDVYTDVDVYALYDPEGTSATTHPNRLNGGQYLLEGVKEGIVTLVVTKPGFNSETVANVRVIAGQTSIVEDPVVLKTPPLPPTGSGAAQNSGSVIRVFWTASASPDVAGYNVYYGTSSDAINQKANVDLVTGTSFDVTGLERGVTYYFGLKAVDNDGLTSPVSPSDGSLKTVIHPTWQESVLSGGYAFNYPFDIALTVSGTTGYVSTTANACLLRIDFSSADPYVSRQINLTGSSPVPTALAMNPALPELYVVDQSQNKLFVFNTSDDASGTTPFSVGSIPRNVIVSQDGSRIYVCSEADNVTVINAATKELVTTISLGEDADPYGMAIANNRLYVAGPWTNKVYMIDLDSGSTNYHKVIGSIAVGNGAYDLVARPDGAFIYVSHSTADGSVSVIDTASNTVVKTIVIRNAGETDNKNPKGMAVNGNVLYVLNWGDSTVTMINTQNNTKLDLGSPLLSGGNGPENLVVSPNGNKLYIVHSSAGSVEILSY